MISPRPSLAKLTADGFTPSAVAETSAGNFQAWLKHPAVLPKLLGTFAAQMLAGSCDAHPSAADWRRFSRLPGFTNCKLNYKRPDGLFPFVRLRSCTGEQYPMVQSFLREITKLYEAREQHREARRLEASLSPQRTKVGAFTRALPHLEQVPGPGLPPQISPSVSLRSAAVWERRRLNGPLKTITSPAIPVSRREPATSAGP